MKKENEKKKAYLRSYQLHVRRVARIEAELVELRAMRGPAGLNMDGMPHGSGKGDLSEYAAELDRLERRLLNERRRRVLAYEDIARRINEIRNENEKDVLFYRYISGLEWWKIAERMRYSERWVLKLHGKALDHFEIPKEIIEDQLEQ